MSANRLFLVCSHHPNPEDALCLAERPGNESGYYPNGKCRCLGKCGCAAKELERQNAWFRKHSECGRDRDHYRLAMSRPADWDVPKPAEKTAAGAVRLELVKGRYVHGTFGKPDVAEGEITEAEQQQISRELATSLKESH